MDSRELVETALRFLKAWTYGDRALPTDIEVLRGHAFAEEVDLPIDELACRIVARECGRVIQESQMDRKPIPANAVQNRKKKAS
jgi:hypothetical protein